MQRSANGKHAFLALWRAEAYAGYQDDAGWHPATANGRVRQPRVAAHWLPLLLAGWAVSSRSDSQYEDADEPPARRFVHLDVESASCSRTGVPRLGRANRRADPSRDGRNRLAIPWCYEEFEILNSSRGRCMAEVNLDRYPPVASDERARTWLRSVELEIKFFRRLHPAKSPAPADNLVSRHSSTDWSASRF
jgi:hypothetical protein